MRVLGFSVTEESTYPLAKVRFCKAVLEQEPFDALIVIEAKGHEFHKLFVGRPAAKLNLNPRTLFIETSSYAEPDIRLYADAVVQKRRATSDQLKKIFYDTRPAPQRAVA